MHFRFLCPTTQMFISLSIHCSKQDDISKIRYGNVVTLLKNNFNEIKASPERVYIIVDGIKYRYHLSE